MVKSLHVADGMLKKEINFDMLDYKDREGSCI
jgi:hypothetical protein